MSWFSALCDDDYEFLGQPDPALASSFEHCRNIVLTADRYGFDNVLLPSGYALGIDNTAFAAAMAPQTSLRMLLAVRCGETVVPAARPPAGDARPDDGRPPHRQHHLQRRPRRGAGQRPALPPLDRDHVRPARAARRPRRQVPRRLRRPRDRPAAGPHGQRAQPAVLLRRAVTRRPRVRGRRRRRVPDVARRDVVDARGQGRHGCPGRGQGPHAALRLALARHRARDRGRGPRRGPPAAVEARRRRPARRSASGRSTRRRPASPARPRCATAPTTRATSSGTSGPASGGPAPAPARPSSATPIRCWPRSRS